MTTDPGAVADAAAARAPVAPPAAVVPGSLGILGGTFDPIHHGHLVIAEEAREALGLERVLLIPASVPPHKPGRPVSPARHRLAMVELAIAGNPAFEVSRIELERGGRSYSVDTLLALRDRRGPAAADPWFILSSEALAELPTWREPDRILELCQLVVVPRGGFEPLGTAWVTANYPGREDRVRFLPGPLLPISGSVVRRRAAAGRSVRYLVPDAVARYIADQRLYTGPALEDSRPVTDPALAAAPRPDGLPHRETAAPSTDRAPLDLARRIVELAEDKKAADIVLLDLDELTTLADAFVICSGGSERQISAIADGILEGLRDEGTKPIGREGTPESHWVLLDFGAVIVHVFTPPERDYYQLERHWSGAKTVLRVQ